ncbi:MAG TPA: SCO family protein [Streptosporangiaceae bacterium]|nr:SCO family protein [Streptosporangiaceae bacterium]
MNSGLNSNNPTVVAAFRSALLHQGLVVLVVFAVLALAWIIIHEWLRPPGTPAAPGAGTAAEPGWRQLLRIGFGVIWIFDGLLQAQPAMAVGLPSQVIQPAAASSPGWVQHIVNWAGTSWSYHPIQAGAAAVWIQIGLGVWLITASRGPWSRLAGLASAGWALVVWVFGEAFGGIFAPGLTWLFGAPGAAVFYLAAGLLIAAPQRSWRTPQLGRTALGGLGVFFIGMALLQAWPGRGFWQGTLHGGSGTLAGMVRSMTATPQPALFAGWVQSFASFTAAHGFAVNLFAVIALGAIGAGLLTAGGGRPEVLRATVIATVVLCLADWVLVEDFGFFGGLGTDPNSMIPLALLGVAGYLALTRAPDPVTVPAAVPVTAAGAAPAARFGPARLVRAFGGAGIRAVLATWAVAIVLVGAAPMAMAQASASADPILAQAVDGDAAPLNVTAPSFTLTNQYGQAASLAGLRGKVVLLTFLDPVCTSDCPVIAQEFRQADQMLGGTARHVELVAIVANPIYRSAVYTRAFDQQERLTGLRNWLYLTGTLGQLRQTWKNYGVAADILPAGGMIAHSDLVFVIDAGGHTRTELNFDPGPGTSSTESSFAAELTSAADHLSKPS